MQNHTQLPTGLSFSYETERLILRLPSTDYLREIHGSQAYLDCQSTLLL